VFEHLRTLQRILHNYLPRHLVERPPIPGRLKYQWQEATLMFTDLAGFTPLMEANAAHGQRGAEILLSLLNSYFSIMLEIISKSGGDLLEFTGDALLVQFPIGRRGQDSARAVRAGLRMQQAMSRFRQIETPQGQLSLGMRIGIHTARFLTAEIGTPYRMEHIMMGREVQRTKRAEGAGTVGMVCLTPEAYERVKGEFAVEPTTEDHFLVVDHEEELDDYEITIFKRSSSALMLDRSSEALRQSIEEILNNIEPLAAYIPPAILKVLVENAANRQVPPQFARPTVMFVNLMGIPQAADEAQSPEEEYALTAAFSRLFALINAAVEGRGGVLKTVTYHLYGSDIMIMFGIPNAHTDDPRRAAAAALAIREMITSTPPLQVGGREIQVDCQIGLALGPVFASEIGDKRGRREFNVLGDAVNTAARLMAKAEHNTIWITEAVQQELGPGYECSPLGPLKFKGKSKELNIYRLEA
jgi:class 3 adenylate cyclase